MDWGKLPHLMKNGRAEISLSLEAGAFDVHVLAMDGTRQFQMPAAYANGKLTFVSDIGRRKDSASFLYEIVRRPDGGTTASARRKAFDADFTTGTPGAVTAAGAAADAPRKGALPRDRMQAAVQKVLDEAVASGAQSAAQCCVYIDGELVVDVALVHADAGLGEECVEVAAAEAGVVLLFDEDGRCAFVGGLCGQEVPQGSAAAEDD